MKNDKLAQAAKEFGQGIQLIGQSIITFSEAMDETPCAPAQPPESTGTAGPSETSKEPRIRRTKAQTAADEAAEAALKAGGTTVVPPAVTQVAEPAKQPEKTATPALDFQRDIVPHALELKGRGAKGSEKLLAIAQKHGGKEKLKEVPESNYPALLVDVMAALAEPVAKPASDPTDL